MPLPSKIVPAIHAYQGRGGRYGRSVRCSVLHRVNLDSLKLFRIPSTDRWDVCPKVKVIYSIDRRRKLPFTVTLQGPRKRRISRFANYQESRTFLYKCANW